MIMSNHAKIRTKQRGISEELLGIIETYGRCENAPGGVTKIFFGQHEHQRFVTDMKRFLQHIDKIRNCSLIADGNTIITVQRQFDRI